MSNFHSYKSSIFKAEDHTCGACGRTIEIDNTLSLDDKSSKIEILELEIKELRTRNIEHQQQLQDERERYLWINSRL